MQFRSQGQLCDLSRRLRHQFVGQREARLADDHRQQEGYGPGHDEGVGPNVQPLHGEAELQQGGVARHQQGHGEGDHRLGEKDGFHVSASSSCGR